MAPMNNSIEQVRGTLTKMHKDGVLRVKYRIADNKTVADEIAAMVKKDLIV